MRATRREFLWAGGVTAVAPRVVRRDPVRELRHLVRGPVLTPRDSRGLVYDERWQRRRPRAVVQALDHADVQAVVRWAAAHPHIPLRVRSGGHSYGGWGTGSRGGGAGPRGARPAPARGGTPPLGGG